MYHGALSELHIKLEAQDLAFFEDYLTTHSSYSFILFQLSEDLPTILCPTTTNRTRDSVIP